MAQQPINAGNSANDGTGDSLRVACQKINSNTSELYALTGAIQTIANSAIATATAAQTDADQALLDAAAANGAAIAAQSAADTAQADATQALADAAAAQASVDNALNLTTVPFAAIVNVDFATPGYRTISVTGNLELTFSNLAPVGKVRVVTLHLDNDASPHNLTFPEGTVFLSNPVPATITADKHAILVLSSYGNGVVFADYREHGGIVTDGWPFALEWEPFATSVEWEDLALNFFSDSQANFQLNELPSDVGYIALLSPEITSVAGLTDLTNAAYIILNGLSLTTIPALPATGFLTNFQCQSNTPGITSITNFPSTLTVIACGGNQLTAIPPIPVGVVEMDVSFNPFDAAYVNNICAQLVANNQNNGNLFLTNLNTSLSGANIATLQGRGWTVFT